MFQIFVLRRSIQVEAIIQTSLGWKSCFLFCVFWTSSPVSSQDPRPRKPLFCRCCHSFPFFQRAALPNRAPELPRPNSRWREPGKSQRTWKGIGLGTPGETFWGFRKDPGGNSQFERAAVSGFPRSRQHGGAGSAEPPFRDGHERTVSSDVGALEGLF